MRASLVLLMAILLLCSCATERGLSSAEWAQQLVYQGQYQEAVPHWQQAIARSPKQKEWRYNLIWTLYEADEFEQVIDLSDQAIEEFAGDLEFLLIKARALGALGSNEEAFRVYRELFALNPGSWDLQVKVMRLAHHQGFSDIAQSIALGLLDHKQYEREAMQVLSEITPDTWYDAALSYLSR
jgi:tetratricopeptide (TPR) repeat protein